jgi:hypothetical protein
MGTALQSIRIPANVKHICENAFSGCRGLQEVIFEAGSRLSKIDADVFAGCENLRTARVPTVALKEMLRSHLPAGCVIEVAESPESIGPSVRRPIVTATPAVAQPTVRRR